MKFLEFMRSRSSLVPEVDEDGRHFSYTLFGHSICFRNREDMGFDVFYSYGFIKEDPRSSSYSAFFLVSSEGIFDFEKESLEFATPFHLHLMSLLGLVVGDPVFSAHEVAISISERLP